MRRRATVHASKVNFRAAHSMINPRSYICISSVSDSSIFVLHDFARVHQWGPRAQGQGPHPRPGDVDMPPLGRSRPSHVAAEAASELDVLRGEDEDAAAGERVAGGRGGGDSTFGCSVTRFAWIAARFDSPRWLMRNCAGARGRRERVEGGGRKVTNRLGGLAEAEDRVAAPAEVVHLPALRLGLFLLDAVAELLRLRTGPLRRGAVRERPAGAPGAQTERRGEASSSSSGTSGSARAHI